MPCVESRHMKRGGFDVCSTRGVRGIDGIVHIVERLAPGGIETLVTDLVSARPDDQLISLNGSTEELIEAWPRLQDFAARTNAFDKAQSRPSRVVCHEHLRSKRGCATVREMKEGPSGSAIRCRSQATASCCGQKPWW